VRALVFFCLIAGCLARAAEVRCDPARVAKPPLEFRLEEFSVKLWRGPCAVGCPVYTVVVNGSGLVAYYGEDNVARPGEQLATIPRADVEEILDAVYEAGVLGMADKYLSRLEPRVTEGGTVILEYRGASGSARTVITIRIRDFQKRIVFQPEYAPRELVELAETVEEAAGTRVWTQGR